ncbi:MAG: hypothetical protein ACNA8P_13920, partial [Phycisphaerales bacterium]
DCPKEDRTQVIIERQALHAALLGFNHPTTENPVEFTAPLPADLLGFVRLLRQHANPSAILPAPGATIDLTKAIPV